MRKLHLNYYLIEALVLGFGFFIVYLLDSFAHQIAVVLIVVVIYISMGLLHHHLHHDIHKRIVLEYIIISILVISLFIFLKSGAI